MRVGLVLRCAENCRMKPAPLYACLAAETFASHECSSSRGTADRSWQGLPERKRRVRRKIPHSEKRTENPLCGAHRRHCGKDGKNLRDKIPMPYGRGPCFRQ